MLSVSREDKLPTHRIHGTVFSVSRADKAPTHVTVRGRADVKHRAATRARIDFRLRKYSVFLSADQEQARHFKKKS